MRPIDTRYNVTQDFGEGATAGVVGNLGGTEIEHLVAIHGDYQHYGHSGTDIGCPVGTPVRAARSGTVIWCDWDVNLPGGPNDWGARWFFYQRFGGRLTVVQYAPDDLDVYAHQSEWRVSPGQYVNEGDIIGLSGDSSAGMDGELGPHLHTERIVDLAYPTGNGLIYGRTDPTTVWGGLAAQGSITQSQEDDMAFSADQEAFIIKSLESLVNNVATKKDIPTPEENRFTQAALVSLVNNVATKADLAGVSAAVVTAAKSGSTAEEIKAAVEAAFVGLKVDLTVTAKEAQ